MITLKSYTEYFEQLARELLGHTAQKPIFFSASPREVEDGSLRALREGTRTRLDTANPLLFCQDFEGKLTDNRAHNLRDYKSAGFGVLVKAKQDNRAAEIEAYDLAQVTARRVLARMHTDWMAAMVPGDGHYRFVRGFQLDTVSYSQLHYELDPNLVGWLYNFQIHEHFKL